MKPRTLEKNVLEAAENFKVVLVTGARQVGKTTLLRGLAGQTARNYVSLDDAEERRLAKEDPKLFFRFHPFPLLIDEVQYAPELFSQIKLLVDETEQNGQLWLTGSQQFQLMNRVSESLAGRVAVLDLLGFSLAESEGEGAAQTPFFPSLTPRGTGTAFSAGTIFERIWRGSFPQICLGSPRSWATFYKSYLRTYLERDLRQLSNIGDELAFLKFLRIVAARTAQTLSIADISRDAEISPITAKKWLSMLATSGLIFLLPPFHGNVTKRLVKSPKIYFCDTGLCAYLTAWTSAGTLEHGAMSGAFFETFAVTEILKSHLHNGLATQFYYLRDSNGTEIDLLIESDGKLFPVEIKKTASPTYASASNIKKFRVAGLGDVFGDGAVVCNCETLRPLTENVFAVPVHTI